MVTRSDVQEEEPADDAIFDAARCLSELEEAHVMETIKAGAKMEDGNMHPKCFGNRNICHLANEIQKSDYSKAMNGISMDEIKNIVNATGKQDPWKNKRPSRKRAGEIIVAFITKCHHDMDENNQTCPDYNPRIRNLIN